MTCFRIGIDGYNLALPNGTGVATYGHMLVSIMASRGHEIEGVFGIDPGRDPKMRDVTFFETLCKPAQDLSLEQRRRIKARIRSLALNPFLRAKALEVPLDGRVVTAPFSDTFPPFSRLVSSARLFELAHRHFSYYGRLLPLRMENPPPIMHWTYPVPIRMIAARNVYTLHDLVPLRLPYTTLENKQIYGRLISRIAETADHICTVSEASRADIIASAGLRPERITNTFQTTALSTVSVNTPLEADIEAIRSLFDLPFRGYFLFFGAIEPKKNVGRMLEAYLSLGTSTPLVLVGGRGWQNEAELDLLNHAVDSGRRVIRLDHLSRSLLIRLIRCARAVLFPSISEGFGLPILEAMQLGTAVLTSNISAMPEVAGDAAVLVDPFDPRDIARGIYQLDRDPALRARLEIKGITRALEFSPGRYAARLEQMYGSLLPPAV